MTANGSTTSRGLGRSYFVIAGLDLPGFNPGTNPSASKAFFFNGCAGTARACRLKATDKNAIAASSAAAQPQGGDGVGQASAFTIARAGRRAHTAVLHVPLVVL